jgi:aspartate carbamoyltransferase regulatory subunit
MDPYNNDDTVLNTKSLPKTAKGSQQIMIFNNNNTKISKREPVAHNVEVLLEQHQNKSFKCFYCTKSHSTDIERITHIDYEHPGKIYYPTPEDFENIL